MRRTAALIALITITLASAAEARESTLNMSCGQAAALVAAQGAVVLSTGRNTFDRFVAHRGFCTSVEYADRAWAPTRDGRCRIGFICRSGPDPFSRFRF